ncbi:hypothetical protein CVT24_002401 [Panaeolus cyanescens]|uniref:Uncharacterized protein n=1 Tax=Panaeolus cyanescens TaxID=181874 RepID=A0A409W0Y8_9AGAR|nr:hypothetical protein CVT24_002401 [Panaeolus cyanescens]
MGIYRVGPLLNSFLHISSTPCSASSTLLTVIVTHMGIQNANSLGILDNILVERDSQSFDAGSSVVVPVGAIVGGVIGGVAVGVGLCLAVYFLIRRRQLAKRWRRRRAQSINSAFDVPEIEHLAPCHPHRRITPFFLRPTHKITPSDGSITAPLVEPHHPHYTDQAAEPTRTVAAAAYTSHHGGLFSAPLESAGTIDHFSLPSPGVGTRDYEQAVTRVALEGPTRGALQVAPGSFTPMLVHVQSRHTDRGIRATMRPDEVGYSFVQG